jgi:AcrR family transcriptional regulator
MTEGDARARLRDAALDLFGRHGVQATSTRAILDAAGMRNPSSISYHFGSKAGLVDDLVEELISDAWPVVVLQVDLAAKRTPTIEEWAAVAADSAAQLVSTERGCLLARVWWEWDCILYPEAFEEFLASGLPLAEEWQSAITKTFPDLPPVIAVARNLVVIRTIEWMIGRRAARILSGHPTPSLYVKDPENVSRGLLEIALAVFTAPTTLTAEDIAFD